MRQKVAKSLRSAALAVVTLAQVAPTARADTVTAAGALYNSFHPHMLQISRASLMITVLKQKFSRFLLDEPPRRRLLAVR